MLRGVLARIRSRTDARAFRVFSAAIGFIAILKGLHLALRVGGQSGFAYRGWFGEVPDFAGAAGPVALIALWFVCAVALLLGLRPRVAAAGLAVLATSFAIADSRIYNQHLYLIGLVALIIALTDLRAGTVPRWSPFLIKFQASTVYGFGALAKLSVDFVTGRVLFTVFAHQPVAQLLGGAASDARLLVGLSLATIGTELFLAIGAWVTRLRGLVLAVAGPFHLGMLLLLPLSLQGLLALSVFGAIQLTILLVVFAPRDRLVVVWDDQCSFCSRWVRAFTRLDHLRLLDLRPLSQAGDYAATGIRQEAARDALQLRAADGSIHGGFEAVRRIAYALPLTMLLAPWLSLWPVRAIGGRAYRRVAIRRQCAVGSATA